MNNELRFFCENLATLLLADKDSLTVGIDDLVGFIKAGDPGVVTKILQNNNISPNQKLPDGSYPIHIVMKLKTNASIMFLALSSGQIPLDVNVQDTNGNTALHLACSLVDQDLVDTLLLKGANPNAKNSTGDTALHIACRLKAVTLCKTLLKNKNTNPSIKNNNGQAANQLTDVQGATEIIEAFMDRAIQDSGAVKGELEIALLWGNANDLDLHVICPHGFKIHYAAKKSSCCSGELDVDMNAGGPSSDTQPVEHIYWKSNVPTGNYKIMVDHYSVNCPTDKSKFLIVVKHHKKKNFL